MGEIKHLDQVEQHPESASQPDLGATSSQAKETTRQMKQIAEQKPSGDLFGPGLGSALSDEKKKAIDKDLDQLGQSTDPAARKELASRAGQDLKQISQAFEQSQPKALQQAKERDSLKEPNSLEKAMEQLQGLLNRMQGARPLSDQDAQKLAREAQLNLRDATKESPSNEAAKKLLLMLDDQLKSETNKIDLAGIKKIMNEVESYSAQVKDPSQKTNDPAVSSVDASKLPPAYRGRIENYFRKLSESK